jgi:hypothetical protein
MNIQEFSNRFDTQLNSFSNAESITLDEYEKSVFLTQAQEDVALGLYTGKNVYGESFEQTEELRRYLAPIVEEATLSATTNSSGMPLSSKDTHAFFTLPDGSNEGQPAVWFITFETIKISSDDCLNGTSIEVVPVRQDEYHKIKKNPFRGANSHRALRLDLSDNVVEIISKYAIPTENSYYIRYLRKLKPIVLVNLEDMDIQGEHNETPCELPDILHQKILDRAVLLALQSKGITNKNRE